MKLTKEELKGNIINSVAFGKHYMEDLSDTTGPLENYNIRILTLFTHIDEMEPLMQLRYELKGEKLKLWISNGDGDNGMIGVPTADTFEENLEAVTWTIYDQIERLNGDGVMWSINWLGE